MRGKRTNGGSGLVTALALLAALVLGGGWLGAPAEPAGASFVFNGRIAFASNRTTGQGVNNPEGDVEIFTMKPDGSGLKQLTKNAAADFEPAWSRNGKMIAFTSTRDGNNEVYTMRADGKNQTNRSKNAALDGHPTWSPDGKRIAFVSDRDSDVIEGIVNFEVYTMKADGTGQARFTNSAAFDGDPAWSPDGKQIAFTSRRDGNLEVYTMAAKDADNDGNGDNPINLTNSPSLDMNPAWSPNGKRLAFVSERDGDFEIFTMAANGSAQSNLSANAAGADFSPAWSSRGDGIAFVSNRDGNPEIYTMKPDGTKQTNRTKNSANDDTPAWQAIRIF